MFNREQLTSKLKEISERNKIGNSEQIKGLPDLIGQRVRHIYQDIEGTIKFVSFNLDYRKAGVELCNFLYYVEVEHITKAGLISCCRKHNIEALEDGIEVL